MNFVRSFLKTESTHVALPFGEVVPLNYSLSCFRWHMDTRPPTKAVFLHDLFSSCSAWQQTLHRGMSELPLIRQTPKNPIELYALDLRDHGGSSSPSSGSGNFTTSYVLDCAGDVINFQEHTIREPVALVGVGFGAMVAAVAALAGQERFSSVTMLVDDVSELVQCNPQSYLLPKIIASVPPSVRTLAGLEEHLISSVKNPFERAAVLNHVKEALDGTLTWKFSDALLEMQHVRAWPPKVLEEIRYHGNATVFHSPGALNLSSCQQFRTCFPESSFQPMSAAVKDSFSLGTFDDRDGVVSRLILEATSELGVIDDSASQ